MTLYPVPALTKTFAAPMTPFSVNIFPNIEAPEVPNNIPRNTPSSGVILCLTALINTPEFFNDLVILIKNKVIPYTALTTPL